MFNALNSLELKSLEEPRYLLQQFARAPLACLTLASFVATNTGDVARKCIQVGGRAVVWVGWRECRGEGWGRGEGGSSRVAMNSKDIACKCVQVGRW